MSASLDPDLVAPPRRSAFRANLYEVAAVALAVAFVLYAFVGSKPFAFTPHAPNPGLDRLYVSGMFLVACFILAHRWRFAVRVAAGAPLVWLTVGICVASVVWAVDPASGLRRSAMLAMLVVSAFAAVVGAPSLRALLRTTLLTMMLVMLVNLATTALVPSFAFDYNGVRGAHPSKNMAGYAMLLIIIFSVGWLSAPRSWTALFIGGALLVLASGFLLSTQSKTSTALAVATIAGGGAILSIWRFDPRLGVLAATILGASVAAVFVAIGAAGWDRADVFEAVFGDPTFTKRTDIWAFVSEDVAARPWLGFGYGSYWNVEAVFDPFARLPLTSWMLYVEEGILNQAHNGYLDLQIQIGLPATIIAVLSIVWAFLRAFGGAVAAPAQSDARIVCWIACLTIGAVLIHNFMEASIYARMVPAGNFVLMLAFAVERAAVEREVERMDPAAPLRETR